MHTVIQVPSNAPFYIALKTCGNEEEAINEMLGRRKSIFYGSIFKERPGLEVQRGDGLSYEEKLGYKEKLS